MVANVLVVQHGEKVGSPGDPGLTAAGRDQARATANWLAARYPDVVAIWSSPFARARETAGYIAKAVGLELRIDVRLRERMNWESEIAISIDDFLEEWHRATADPDYQPPIGDSSSVAAARFTAALADIESHVADGTAVVVAHGGVTVDTLRAIAGDVAVTEADPTLISSGVQPCAVTTFTVKRGAVSVVSFPSVEHLGATS